MVAGSGGTGVPLLGEADDGGWAVGVAAAAAAAAADLLLALAAALIVRRGRACRVVPAAQPAAGGAQPGWQAAAGWGLCKVEKSANISQDSASS